MSRIDVGYLRLLYKDRTYEFGTKDSELKSEIKVINDSFWIRLLLSGCLVSITQLHYVTQIRVLKLK